MDFKSLLPEYTAQSEDNFKYRFTVFTPVYNAEETIRRTHRCLVDQTFDDFEWLVINDGSTDGTHEVLTELAETSPLNVRYINNPKNQHKMACFLQAIELADGELLLTFDADDECMPESLQVFNDEFESVDNDKKAKVIAVTGLCVDEHGNQVGESYPTDPYYSDPLELFAIAKVRGEKWGFTKTSALRAIDFDRDIKARGYIPESIIWNLLAKEGFKTKYINKVLRVYHVGIENSISKVGMAKSAYGSTIHYISNFNWFFKSYWYKAPVFFLKTFYYLVRLSRFQDYGLKTYTRSIDPFIIKLMFTFFWPVRSLFR